MAEFEKAVTMPTPQELAYLERRDGLSELRRSLFNGTISETHLQHLKTHGIEHLLRIPPAAQIMATAQGAPPSPTQSRIKKPPIVTGKIIVVGALLRGGLIMGRTT